LIQDLLHTGATFGFAVSTILLLGPVAIPIAMLDPRNADPFIRFFCRGLMRAAGIRIATRGMENLPGGTCVLVSNHQSNFDPFAIHAVIPKHMRWVAKAELYRIPIFGQALKAVGAVKVDRKGGEADRKTLADAVQSVRERVSLAFCPEGTRSEDGLLGPFKKGAAVMAIQAGVPLVPMAIAGTKDILPKHTGLIRGGQRVVVEVGEAIATNGMRVEDRDTLTERAHAAVARLLAKANAELEGGA
jgi:1-acyl-sn-glycerol-3-phosphate acyltransferase